MQIAKNPVEKPAVRAFVVAILDQCKGGIFWTLYVVKGTNRKQKAGQVGGIHRVPLPAYRARCRVTALARSKSQLEAELNQARIIHCVIDHGKRGSIEVRALPVSARRAKLRVIE